MPSSFGDIENKLFKAMVNAIPDMIIRIGKDKIFRGFEGNVNDLYWPVDTYIGKTIDEVMPEPVVEKFSKAIEKTFASEAVQRLEYTLTINNRIQYYEMRLVKCNEDEFIALVRNVTRETKIKQELDLYRSDLEKQMAARSAELFSAEKNYRDIFNFSGAPSIIIEQDYTISMANQKFETLVGYAIDEIVNQMKWPDFVHPKDQEMATRYHLARRSKEGKAPDEYECRIIDRDKKVKSIFIKVGLLSDPGRTVASIIDITSLKQAEKKLRDREALYSAILEGYEGFVYFINPDYTIRFLNENFIQRLKRDVTGKTCYKAIHNRESKCQWCVADQVFAGRQVRFEMKNPRDKKWYHSVNVPVKLSDDTIYCQSMITDIDEHKRMEAALRTSEDHLLKENTRLRSSMADRHRFGDIIGKSPLMQEVYELLLMAASSENNVIIYGDSGTGKELAAKAIHDMSARRKGRFVPVNCGAVPENLLESEFFGHKKGSFSGAVSDKNGWLDEADKGTLFLDEIGEIKTSFQVKLLRAIEGGGHTPVGSNELHRPDFRIVAATNRNLTELVKSGQMRSDFFYRVHVVPIYLPPLRKRKEDIPLLVDYFFKAYDSKIRPRITSKVMDTLMNYTWPGNVRELQNVLYRFVTMKRLDLTGAVSAADVEFKEAEAVLPAVAPSLADAVAGFEKHQITAALAECRWNRTKTAKRLGIGLRTLQRKMKLYQIK